MDETRVKLNIVVFAKDPYQLDGVLSLFADQADGIIKEIPYDASPYTEYGDLKSGEYNYETLAAQYSDIIFIDDVKTSKITDSLRRSLQTELYIGMIDITIGKHRFPR